MAGFAGLWHSLIGMTDENTSVAGTTLSEVQRTQAQ